MTSFTRIVVSMSLIMMAFGNYNPGWQCIENSTVAYWNKASFSIATPTNASNDTDQCRFYKDCSNIQFQPGISTIVTEWQLICDRSWIASMIISIQMLGLLLGSFISGYLGDRIGRKRTLAVATFYHMIVNFIAIFSTSWYMFAVMRFLIGMAIPIGIFQQLALTLEFVPQKWRAFMMCMPTFALGCIIVAVLAMTIQDWKYIHAAIALGSLFALVPFPWIPESLRWLLVKGKKKDAIAVVKKISKLNGKNVNESEIKEELANLYSNQIKARNYNCYQLLIQLVRKDVRFATCVIGILSVSLNMVYFAISFGVKSMPGNFFDNFIIITCSDIPSIPISAILPNYIGRKLSIILFSVLSTVSLFIVVGLDLGASGSLKSVGIIIFIVTARCVTQGAWDTTITYAGETYPTAVRSTGLAYTSWTARIGGILAPYLIPDDPDLYFINYLIMALCVLACCVLVLFVPETNGKPLQDIWEKSIKNPDIKDETENVFRERANV